MKSLVEQARAACLQAETTIANPGEELTLTTFPASWKTSVELLKKAARWYLEAAEGISEGSLKASLIYLATNCMVKISNVRQMYVTNSAKKVSSNSTENNISSRPSPSDRSTGDESMGATKECDTMLFANRLIHEAHMRRISGLSKIPRLGKLSHDVMVQDLLALESKLNEIGLIRPDSGSRELPPAINSRDISSSYIDAAATSIHMRSSATHQTHVISASSSSTIAAASAAAAAVRHNSNLGESFMFLDPRNHRNDNSSDTSNTRTASELESLAAVTASVTRGSLLPSWLQLQLLQQQQQQQRSYQTVKSVSQKHQQLVPGSSSSSGSKFVLPSVSETSEHSTPAVTWNDQSIILPSSSNSNTDVNSNNNSNNNYISSNNNNISGSSSSSVIEKYRSANQTTSERRKQSGESLTATAQRSSSDLDQLTQSTINYINDQSQSNSAGIVNLLKTVRRLGEENAFLIRRVEMLSHIEEQCKTSQEHIDEFKREYERKFRSLKTLLTEYAATRSMLRDADLQPGNAQESLDGNPMLTADASPAAITATAATGGAANADAAASIGSQQQQQQQQADRQKQLEKMVKALYTRLEKTSNELKLKDATIAKYKKAITKLYPKESDRPAVEEYSPSQQPQQQQQQQQSNATGNKSPLPVSGAVTSRSKSTATATIAAGAAGSAAGSRSSAQLPMKKQLFAMPPHHKHHSTSTLEILQKSVTAKASKQQAKS